MLKKILNSTALNIILISFILTLPYFVFAQNSRTINTPSTSTNPLERMKIVASIHGAYSVDTNNNTAFNALGVIINVVFSFLAIVFLAFITYSGYRWMMASGNQEIVTKSKAVFKQAIIGLAVVVGSWGIWQLVSSLWLNNL
jgi:hypothetical protein